MVLYFISLLYVFIGFRPNYWSLVLVLIITVYKGVGENVVEHEAAVVCGISVPH
jgi:hypothetical protein